METLDNIINTIYEFGSDVFLAFIGYGFIGSVVGLVGMIIIIKKLNKAGKFDRPTKFWRFLASINIIYLPFIAMIFCGCMFGTYGVNSKVNEHVENTIYATVDQMNLESFDFSNLDKHMKTQMTLEEMLATELGRTSNNSNPHQANIIAQAMLKELGYPSQLDDFVVKVRSFDWTVLEKGSKFGLSYIATDYVDGVFWFAYRFLVVFFVASFLKLSIIECIVFMIYNRITGFKSSKSNASAVQTNWAHNELV